jgi:3-phenylpropionate/trans-cinnamate dioxygenase ferredoxin component
MTAENTAVQEITDADFVRVCRLDELPEVGVAAADVNGTIVALARDENGHVHAVNDTCTHANVSLSEGELDGCTLECWLHGSRFNMVTGEPSGPPATVPVAVYPVKIDGDDVYVAVPSPKNLES